MCFAAHRLIDYWMPIDHLGRMDTTKLLLESIATRKCVETVYNRMAVKLAPHILYTRHDELFIDAVTIEREGKPPREIKIGTFKLAGLSQLALTNQEFQPETIFRSEEHTSELQSLMRISYAVFCLKKKTQHKHN